MKKIKLQAGQILKCKNGVEYLTEKGDYILEKKGLRKELEGDLTFRYQMLGRFVADIEYFLDNGKRSERHLWSGNTVDMAEDLIALYDSFSKNEKPEWLTQKEVDYFVKELLK